MQPAEIVSTSEKLKELDDEYKKLRLNLLDLNPA